MTKKHFAAIADSLKSAMPVDSGIFTHNAIYKAELRQWKRCVESVSYALSNTNPRFDRQKFYTACGYEESTTRIAGQEIREMREHM